MDTYTLVELLVKLGMFIGPRDKFVLAGHLITLYTKHDFDGNRLCISKPHPIIKGGYTPWYSYDGDVGQGHCFHVIAFDAKVCRSILRALIVTWYTATEVDRITKPGTYLEFISDAFTIDPFFKGHWKTMAPKPYDTCVAELDEGEFTRMLDKHYRPTKGEPSPFGSAPIGCEHPWTAWRRNHFSTPLGMKGDELRKKLVAVLENEPFRTLADINTLLECEMEDGHGHLTLGWVICMYYNLGSKSWEEIHQVGVNRINFYRRKQEQ
jgi:hypothetical protein